MLTRVIIRNFKQFGEVEIELGQAVVFIGPNNSGKTTALQALVLWDIGLKRWQERRGGRAAPERRPGVTINRRDLVAVPVPDANLLWRNLHVRDVRKVAGKQQTRNVRVDIIVEGVNASEAWACGLEFDYANEESFYCRPLRRTEDTSPERMPVPKEAAALRMAFLPPMSGLAASETRLDPGAINVRLGEGRTAEVLRNLCYQIIMGADGTRQWETVRDRIRGLFGVALDPPQYIPERGEVTMTYRNPSGVQLDLASTGRGLQQTLLLLAHLTLNPGSILLLDEPDAHLEILRQRQIYQLLTETARQQQSQIIAASHSEVVLNEAADRDIVVAFLGKPHRIDDRGSQLLKSLKEIGFEQYYQAEQQGWVLYLEGSTDLAILQAFADILQHPAREALERPFVAYVENQPQRARDHFQGLWEAKPDLVGFALFDRLERRPQSGGGLSEYQWSRREIESYLCSRAVLRAWAEHEGAKQGGEPLFGLPWRETMEQTVLEIEQALTTLNQGSPWSADTKVTDIFLDPLFQAFFRKLGLPNLLRKTDYHVLTRFVPATGVDPEVTKVLDQIVSIAAQAAPVRSDDAGT